LRAQLARHQGAGGEAIDTQGLLVSSRAMVAGQAAPVPQARQSVLAQPVQALPMSAHGTVARSLELRVGPLDNPEHADNLIELFQEIVDLGTIEPIDGGQSSDGMRRFKITT